MWYSLTKVLLIDFVVNRDKLSRWWFFSIKVSAHYEIHRFNHNVVGERYFFLSLSIGRQRPCYHVIRRYTTKATIILFQFCASHHMQWDTNYLIIQIVKKKVPKTKAIEQSRHTYYTIGILIYFRALILYLFKVIREILDDVN